MPATRLIDTWHLGLDRVIGVWERDGILVDPGPASTIDTVLAELPEGRPRAVLLTHIHLDHAGATGTLTRRFPDLPVYVHEAGAPHLIDPSRLLRSAARLYGDRMDELWGEVVPVPERNVVALAGGEVVEGLEVLAAPGHASHHVVFLDPGAGAAFVGDVAGVRIPPGDTVWLPTPPPDIDLERWRASIAMVAERRPARLMLTHYGSTTEPERHLAATVAELERLAVGSRAGDRERFLADLEERIAAEPPELAERTRSAMPPEQTWLGLERYWRIRET
ncbi:MAG TPA: MBL fold metallo-hydrolase [Solirubrobacterales bacterium]|nr:MBL fold metallo-hydrolase [Solirubrobacterales bacterium]